jgi:ribose transport system substrate-binding protein
LLIDCSGAGASASSKKSVAAAQAVVNRYLKAAKFVPGPKFDAKLAKGKTVMYLSVNANNTFAQDTYVGVKQALATVGVKSYEWDGMSSVSTIVSGINEAISRHVAAIIDEDVVPTTVTTALSKARAAGIPVIGFALQDAGTPPSPSALISAQVSFPYSSVGTLLAAYDVVATSGHANALVITSSDSANAPFETAGITKGFKTLCPSTCKYKVVNIPTGLWESEMASTAASASANPDLNTMIPLYDPAVPLLQGGIKSAGATGRVKLISFNATPGIINGLKDPKVSGLIADPGDPYGWTGWAIADETLRLVTGAPKVANENVPVRLFDQFNIGKLDLKSPNTWYGNVSYQAGYKKVWEIG